MYNKKKEKKKRKQRISGNISSPNETAFHESTSGTYLIVNKRRFRILLKNQSFYHLLFL